MISKAKLAFICLSISIMNANMLFAQAMPEGWPWRGVDTMSYVIESDPDALKFIIKQKIHYVRIHLFKAKTMKKKKVNGDQALELNLFQAKKVYEKLKANGVKSFITLADFPISEDKCIDKRDTSYWKDQKCIDQIYKDVKRTVEFFKDSEILGYEFMGEPVVVHYKRAMQPKNWNKIFENIIKIVRQVDTRKYIFFSPGPWGSPEKYDEVVPFKDQKIIYNAHMYSPHRFTHQMVKNNKNFYEYPGRIRFKYWNKMSLEESLQPMIDFQKKYHKPVCISEFSAALWGEGSDRYIEDLIDIFNAHQWSWMYFNIGSDYKGWDARYDGEVGKNKKKKYIYLGEKSKRMQVLKKYFKEGK